jgi:hypothetical protein
MGEPIDPNSFLTRPGFIDGFHIPRLRRSNEIYSAFGAQMKSVATVVSPVVVAAF